MRSPREKVYKKKWKYLRRGFTSTYSGWGIWEIPKRRLRRDKHEKEKKSKENDVQGAKDASQG